MKIIQRWLAVSLYIVFFFASFNHAHAQSIQVITAAQAEYIFGQQLTIIADMSEGTNAVDVQVFFRSKGDTNTISGKAALEPSQAVYVHDLSKQSLKPFTEIEYWFSTTMADGTSQSSQVFSFQYEDNRFAWKTMEDAPFRVHWYEGDATFGQMILDVARAGLQRAQGFIDFPQVESLDIYVYASGADLRSSLQLAGLTMIAGHADPALGMIFVSLPTGPGQRMETARQVPHELVHILLYQKLGSKSAILPIWLNEGLASFNEETANPDYYVVLEEASKNNTLIPITQLCNGFPQDGANFFLSYAESDSFIRYLYQAYGASRLELLIDQYADGIACEIAPQSVFNASLADLDRSWKEQEFGYNTSIEVFAPLIPWAIVLGVAVLAPGILILFSTLRPASQKK